MDDIDRSSNKSFSISTGKAKNGLCPIKKCHYLEGKYFTVFDISIVEKLGIFNDELYFYQELTDDGCIILRPYKVSE